MSTEEDFRARTRATWAAGEWDDFAKLIAPVGELVLGRAAVEPGASVLDVGTGSGGNIAIPAARLGAQVVGVDVTPELLLTARAHAQAADELPSVARCREVLAELRPVASVRAAVETFRAANLDGRRVVGVHLRHGNGGDIGDHARYWTDFDGAVERCAAAAVDARARLGGNAVVFLATDSQPAAEAFRALSPETVVRSKFFRRPGDGDLHLWPLGFVSRVEAIVDMLLLAECDALVRFPPGSFFSFYASVMKRRPPLAMPHQQIDRDGVEPLVVW